VGDTFTKVGTGGRAGFSWWEAPKVQQSIKSIKLNLFPATWKIETENQTDRNRQEHINTARSTEELYYNSYLKMLN